MINFTYSQAILRDQKILYFQLLFDNPKINKNSSISDGSHIFKDYSKQNDK